MQSCNRIDSPSSPLPTTTTTVFSGTRIFGKLHSKRLGNHSIQSTRPTITYTFSVVKKYSSIYSKIVQMYSMQVLGRPSSFSAKLLAHDSLPIPGSVVLPYGAPSFDPACTRESCRGYSRNFLLCCGSRNDRGPLGVSPSFSMMQLADIPLEKNSGHTLHCKLSSTSTPIFPPSFFVRRCCC